MHIQAALDADRQLDMAHDEVSAEKQECNERFIKANEDSSNYVGLEEAQQQARQLCL